MSLFGTMRTGPDEALDARIREGKVLVGTGPEAMRRGIQIEVPVHWYLDPADPSRLWCALGSFYFAWLWVPVEPEPAALAEVLSQSRAAGAVEHDAVREHPPEPRCRVAPAGDRPKG